MGRKKKDPSLKKEKIVKIKSKSKIDDDDFDSIDDESSSSSSFNEEDDSDTDIEILDIDSDLSVNEDMSSEDDNDEIIMSKHKVQGKHSLKYDTIFKGKKDDSLIENEFEENSSYYNDNFEVDKSSRQWTESMDNENYIREKRIKEKIYDVLSKKTDMDFTIIRRKPTKTAFNNYFFTLKNELVIEKFTNYEIFLELAPYFSDNYASMYKLLDSKWRNLIYNELLHHKKRRKNDSEISMRNINVETEIEFDYFNDINMESQKMAGIIIEIIDKNISVKTHERLYNIEISNIIKIINNNSFSSNITKIDETDFL